MTFSTPAPEGASVHQLAAALMALGAYSGDNSPAEHDDEAARLGGAGPYRMSLANALLGAAQIEAILAESLAGDVDELFAAHRQQLIAAGVDDEAGKLAEFLRWQTVRVAGPLRQIAQDPSTGPIPVAAAHAADGLQRLLGVIASGQVPSVEGVAAGIAEMKAARQALLDGVANVDILLGMLGGLQDVLGDG